MNDCADSSGPDRHGLTIAEWLTLIAGAAGGIWLLSIAFDDLGYDRLPWEAGDWTAWVRLFYAALAGPNVGGTVMLVVARIRTGLRWQVVYLFVPRAFV